MVGHPLFWQLSAGATWPPGIVALSSGGRVDRDAFARIGRGQNARAIEIYGSTETGGVGLRRADQEVFALLPWWEPVGGQIARSGERPVALPDEVDWLGPRLLNPVRRRDGVVQVAGNNVSPEAVASVLRAHPQVRDACVRLMNRAEGDRLKAFVVPMPETGQDVRSALETWCLERLQPFERPRAFTFGPSLPRTPEGKLRDWPIS